MNKKLVRAIKEAERRSNNNGTPVGVYKMDNTGVYECHDLTDYWGRYNKLIKTVYPGVKQ